MRVTSLLSRQVFSVVLIRVIGTLVLDCGHGIFRNCLEDHPNEQNQEIHPVYSIDLLQNFHLPRPTATYTGVWAGSDIGTYYVRQLGDTIWWLGLSQDQGRSFANVFKGNLQGSVITGEWADVPVGTNLLNAGTLAVVGDGGPASIRLNRNSETGNFGAQSWQKLYDVNFNLVRMTFETATANAADFWSDSSEPFELTLNDRRLEASPRNPRPLTLPLGVRGSQVDLATEIAFQAPSALPLTLSVRYQGYRLSSSSVQRAMDFAPGSHTLLLTPPDRTPISPTVGIPSGSIPKPTIGQVPDNTSLPSVRVTYRVDITDIGNLAPAPSPLP